MSYKVFFALMLTGLSCIAAEGSKIIRVLAWSERTEPVDIYPKGINGQIAAFLGTEVDLQVTVANLSDPEQGLSEAALAKTDVLLWFGHKQHGLVTDENVERVINHIHDRGMGFLPLHSAHYSKPFQRILKTIAFDRGKPLEGTPGKWAKTANNGAKETIHVLLPGHPIAKGVQDFVIPHTEVYWNPFIAPEPDKKILEGRYEKDLQDSNDGLLWAFGKGQMFYFRPGHETYPIFFQPEVQQVIRNAIRFLALRE